MTALREAKALLFLSSSQGQNAPGSPLAPPTTLGRHARVVCQSVRVDPSPIWGRLSGYETHSNGLSDGVSTVAGTKLALRFFDVAADCLRAKVQVAGNLAKLFSNRQEAQN